MDQIIVPYIQQDQKCKRARRVLYRCISELKEEVRELLFSLEILEPVPIQEKLPLMTNGKELYYSPDYVLETEREVLKQEIFHIVLHGIFGHFEEDRHLSDTELAWAVMDLQVERMSRFLRFGKYAVVEKSQDDRRSPVGMEYYFRAAKRPRLREKVLKSGEQQKRDDHNAWRMKPIALLNCSGASDEWKQARELLIGSTGNRAAAAAGSNLERQLEEALKRIGSGAGKGIHNVQEQSGKTIDYQSLLASLRKMGTVCGEEDAPDPMYYSYGLDLYEDIPLVEPLEEGERPLLDTVAVAVDISGSCISDLPHFLHETRELFRQLYTTTKVSNVYYLECDERIQKEVLYDGAEIDRVFSGEHVYQGGGGTDFTPVFQKLEEYEKQGGHISCLLYYSDGVGQFPEKKADFPCYFIHPDKLYQWHSRLPEWITGVCLG